MQNIRPVWRICPGFGHQPERMDLVHPHRLDHYFCCLESTEPSIVLDGDSQGCQYTHKGKVGKDPRKGNRKAEKCTKLGKELKLAKEERNAGHDTGNHSVHDTDTHVTKGSRDSFISVTRGDFISVRKMDLKQKKDVGRGTTG